MSLLVSGCATAVTASSTGARAVRAHARSALKSAKGRGSSDRTVSSASEVSAPLKGPARREAGHPVVYLTFDDGPFPGGTSAILAVLKRHQAKATFFDIGWRASSYPDLVRQEIAAGDSVGVHTWTHPHLTTLPRAQVADQLVRTRDVIRSLGAPARCYRPPFGQTNATVNSVARSLNLHDYLWTVESKDWTLAPASVDLSRAVAGLRPGAIVVFHDREPLTPLVVDQFLTIAHQRGYVAAALPC